MSPATQDVQTTTSMHFQKQSAISTNLINSSFKKDIIKLVVSALKHIHSQDNMKEEQVLKFRWHSSFSFLF